jgi:hypothetical protein
VVGREFIPKAGVVSRFLQFAEVLSLLPLQLQSLQLLRIHIRGAFLFLNLNIGLILILLALARSLALQLANYSAMLADLRLQREQLTLHLVDGASQKR